MNPDQTLGIEEVAILAEPVRRALYAHVTSASEPVGREAAAAAVGISRSLAAFHLDRLVEAGLLDVTYRRLSGRTGPGAGRPAKLYRRGRRAVDITLPPRRYELAARLLADALATTATDDGSFAGPDALATAAEQFGRQLGEAARRRAAGRRGRHSLIAAAIQVLGEAGFEPAPRGDDLIALRNCPFDAVARTNRPLVCGSMNLPLMRGVVAGLGATGIVAELDPEPGMCCVVWRTRSSSQQTRADATETAELVGSATGSARHGTPTRERTD